MGQAHNKVWTSGLAPLLAAALLFSLFLFAPQVLNDGDTWWHLAAGQWMLSHHQVPHGDPFSFTMPGSPWVAHEWLSEVLTALAWQAANWAGVLVLYGAALAVAGFLVTRYCARFLAGVPLILIGIIPLACLAPSILARPHLLVLPVLVGWTLELLAARDQARAPRPVFALLMLGWANLHGSFVFGFILAGAFGLEALISGRDQAWKVIRDWGLFAVLSLAAATATPHGLAGLAYPFQLMSLTFLPYIAEWRAVDFTHLSAFPAALLGTLFVLLWRGVRIPPVRLLLLLLLVYMSLQHVRHLLVLAVVAPLILAQPLADNLGRERQDWRVSRAMLAGFAALVLLLTGVRLLIPVVRSDGLNTPASALAHVPAELAAQPVLNDYGFGGYLIFRGVKPFIDGRSDMYGNAFSLAYFHAVSPEPVKLDALLDRYHVAWTIFPPTDPVVRRLDAEPGWRRLYSDPYAVVQVRSAPPAPASPAG